MLDSAIGGLPVSRDGRDADSGISTSEFTDALGRKLKSRVMTNKQRGNFVIVSCVFLLFSMIKHGAFDAALQGVIRNVAFVEAYKR